MKSRAKKSKAKNAITSASIRTEKSKSLPLSRIVTIPPKPYPSTNIENDNIAMLENYLPSASTLEIVERFSAGLRGSPSGRMISVTGPYGSGKSTMAAFLNGLLSPKHSIEWKAAHNILKNEPEHYEHTLVYARKKAGIHDEGMIRCTVTARREPITVTILRALYSGVMDYFGRCSTRDFAQAPLLKRYIRGLKNNEVPDSSSVVDIIRNIAGFRPITIIIDEFGKNIEYFTVDESQKSDLFLLQELAEMSGKKRRIPLSIITLQHMAFEEYAVGASATQKSEWAKIQGRFEDIPFANSPDQTRLLISNTIKLSNRDTLRRKVVRWAKRESSMMQDLGMDSVSDPNLIVSCYPLNPLALEALPELCSRYGQHERTLLSFISNAQRHTVATFIDNNSWSDDSPPTVGLDVLYDYFISGTNMIHSSSMNITRLMEIETIIRDSHDLDKKETLALKTIGILNLIGRSGYLRASRRMMDYAMGENSGAVLKILEKKSLITYRKYADEYRIWHGTDIDITLKLDMYRKRYHNAPLAGLLGNIMSLDPIVAARHSIKTGTMRIFERSFMLEPGEKIGKNCDGMILYKTRDTTRHDYGKHKKPLIIVSPGDTTELKFAATEVIAIRDILKSDDEVTSDWVAKRELEERLADAEVVLDRAFASTYDNSSKWSCRGMSHSKMGGTPSETVSAVCDMAYPNTPMVRNEMINRTSISTQASTAKRKLLEMMITNTAHPRFGIEGNGPDMAVYEAVFYRNKIHIHTPKSWTLRAPTKSSMTPVWNAMLDVIKRSKRRVVLEAIYDVVKNPPYGIKDGVVQLIMVAIMLVYADNIALYEHGTYVPRLRPEIAERMTKNPAHFELKHFKNTPTHRKLISQLTRDLKIESADSVLGVVSHLIRIVSTLPPHIKNTKRLDKETIAVRNTILEAVEPDTLLFESLPKALGFRVMMSPADMKKFSKKLARSMKVLQDGFENLFIDIRNLLFDATGIDERVKLSKAASSMVESVSDHGMKVFLGALSADTLEREQDWINYVAMSLTDVPPIDWKDEQREMFENNLRSMSLKFTRLASIHFAKVSDSFVKPSYQVTVTHADGKENHSVVSLRPEQEKMIKKLRDTIRSIMKKEGLTKNDMGALMAVLSQKL